MSNAYEMAAIVVNLERKGLIAQGKVREEIKQMKTKAGKER